MRRALLALGLVAALAGGCGGDDDYTGGESAGGKPQLVVSAASSMTEALTACSKSYPDAELKLQFAGSDELAAQIRQGVKPDVFAAANTRLPNELHSEGLLSKPVVFATNEFVLAVPDGSDIAGLDDLEATGVKIAIGSESVPVGSYTRTVLAKLPESESSKILGNVRTQEPDVAGIVGKLTQGAVDAGFVYISDVRATDGKLKAIELPEALQPTVGYGVAVVRGAKNGDAAKAFVDGLLDGDGKRALDDAGFEPPPAQ